MKINEALRKLDVENDQHWTADGMPKMGVVEELVGDKSITRKDVTNAAPDFNREAIRTQMQEQASNSEQGTADHEPEPLVEEPEKDAAKTAKPTGPLTSSSPVESVEVKENKSRQAERAARVKEACKEFSELTDIEELDSEIQGMEEQVTSILKAISEGKEDILDIEEVLGAAQAQRNSLVPETSNSTAIQDYIKSQNKQRAERAKRAKEISKHFDLSSFQTKAPIDAAMSRKNKRGASRPNMPVK